MDRNIMISKPTKKQRRCTTKVMIISNTWRWLCNINKVINITTSCNTNSILRTINSIRHIRWWSGPALYMVKAINISKPWRWCRHRPTRMPSAAFCISSIWRRFARVQRKRPITNINKELPVAWFMDLTEFLQLGWLPFLLTLATIKNWCHLLTIHTSQANTFHHTHQKTSMLPPKELKWVIR